MPAGTIQTIVVCAADGTVNMSVCDPGTKAKLIQGYVLDIGTGSFFDDLIFNGVFDVEAMTFGFGAVVTFFVVGLSIGLVVSVIRKAR